MLSMRDMLLGYSFETRPNTGFIQKTATILQGFFKDHIRFFQGPPTRNLISQVVQKSIIKTLRLELFFPPTSLHFSVRL